VPLLKTSLCPCEAVAGILNCMQRSSTSACRSVLDLIGNTPVQLLDRIVNRLGLEGQLVAKLESVNPGGSMKDRVALAIIRQARASGALAEGQPVIEVTSGNTGIGLALVCKAMGHPFIAVMSRGNSPERAQMMRAFGAEVVLVDQCPPAHAGRVTGQDMAAVKERAAVLQAERGAYFSNQFENPSNPQAHFETTGPELLQQCGGKVDVVLAFAGTGGALGGLARFFREASPDTKVIAVEPECAASLALACCMEAAHLIQGGGYGKPALVHLDPATVDGYICCSDEDAIAGTRLLAEEEGIFAGYSSGAHLHAATTLLRGPARGKRVAFLICDTGLKYMSTGLFG